MRKKVIKSNIFLLTAILLKLSTTFYSWNVSKALGIHTLEIRLITPYILLMMSLKEFLGDCKLNNRRKLYVVLSIITLLNVLLYITMFIYIDYDFYFMYEFIITFRAISEAIFYITIALTFLLIYKDKKDKRYLLLVGAFSFSALQMLAILVNWIISHICDCLILWICNLYDPLFIMFVLLIIMYLILSQKQSSSLNKVIVENKTEIIAFKYCNNCGRQLEASEKKCPSCGHDNKVE